jgi:protocatechuate 3,4-dioxygenase beta subunit
MELPHDDDDHDRGLAFDVSTLLSRRGALRLLAGTGMAAVLAACGADSKGSTSVASTTSTTSTSTTGGSDASCSTIPEETAGPFPGDGSNGPDVLTESGIVRSDITSSFGSSSTVADGVPLTIDLVVQDTADGCSALSGAAVYVWHCDREGRYSMYSAGATEENYLRGVQETDADGRVSFTSVFPAAYPGRWPHIHFEVYASLQDATGGGSPRATSQIALPEDTCNAVYATTGYEASVATMRRTSLQSDMVFGDDGGVRQLGTVSGSVEDGLAVELTVPA